MKPEVINAVVLSQLDYCNYCKRNKKSFNKLKINLHNVLTEIMSVI